MEPTALNPEYMAKTMGLTVPKHTSQFSHRIFVKTFPFLGRIHFVKDRAGIYSLLFVIWYWIYGTWCGIFVILLPRYEDGEVSGAVIVLYFIIALFCLVSVLRASTTNPGRVPLLEEISGLNLDEYEVCRVCQRHRPKRAHHCRRCQQCVLRMDHHCPWINNCVGEENHWLFFLVLVYAFLLSASAFVLCMLHFWWFPPCQKCDKTSFIVRHSIWFTYLLTVMAVFMSMFMLGQFIGQHFNLVMDRTTLQNMKDPRPNVDEIKFRTVSQGYQEMCGEGPRIFRLLPCRKRRLKQQIHTSDV